jgi:hypothetical protein
MRPTELKKTLAADATALMHASDSLKDDENIVKAKNIGLKCMRPKDFKQRLGCNFFLM